MSKTILRLLSIYLHEMLSVVKRTGISGIRHKFQQELLSTISLVTASQKELNLFFDKLIDELMQLLNNGNVFVV